MKIMTFNTQHCLNYVTRKIDFEVMAEAIKKINPDIVGLNEMRGEGSGAGYQAQVDILSSLTGLNHFYFAKAIDMKDGPYGNGFLSAIPISKIEKIMIPDPNPRTGTRYYETRCLIKAELENGLTVLVTHFGLNDDEQINAVNTVLENIKEEKCVLMGDFNANPNEKVLDPIRAKMKDTADVFDEEKLSWPSINPECKIDYIFVSKDIEVISADIPNLVASDHRPHIAEIKF